MLCRQGQVLLGRQLQAVRQLPDHCFAGCQVHVAGLVVPAAHGVLRRITAKKTGLCQSKTQVFRWSVTAVCTWLHASGRQRRLWHLRAGHEPGASDGVHPHMRGFALRGSRNAMDSMEVTSEAGLAAPN